MFLCLPAPILNARQSSSAVILDLPERIALGVVAGMWLVVVLGGGSARADVPYLLVVRGAALFGLALLLLLIPPQRLRPARGPLLFTAAAALVIAVQLIPLPPSLWTALPGRAPYAALSALPDIGDVWRPISLSPDLTWNALLSLVPTLVFLLAIPPLPGRARRWVLKGLLVTILLSGFLGMLQIAGGPDSALRHYQYTNWDSATGFFANRNHQAVFLAMGIPLASWWAGLEEVEPRRRRGRLVIAASIILFLLTAAVTTQSRTGAVIVLLALLLSALYGVKRTGLGKASILWIAGGALLVGAMGAAALATWSDYRRGLGAAAQDLRIRILPESLDAAWTFFPFGSGFGSFPHIFPRFESAEDLSASYVNHTHSELTQIVIEGGAVAILLLLAFLCWYVFAVRRAWWGRGQISAGAAADAQLCTILIALPLVASITDYPIRTPLLACCLAAAAAILSGVGRVRRPQR